MTTRHLLFAEMLVKHSKIRISWYVDMNIRQARQAKGFTQQQLAQRTGIDQAAISRMENGKQRITVDDLRIMAEALGIDPRDLLPDVQAA
jgi:transcriptional regulator with XRE-family HTH domain